ncbi:hypothetical protein OH146_02755 [Salinibacterium sp. SYSU T00001]|uniref:SCO7613 C-terminal domain-containing membrane protein n=1 Tax=Homoserinimonas sedimenticola TaxID=2986805 RepID=UPI002235F3E1|nr:hypothetical protein [Salinibacterium sedimenticola]MCW4384688.1 hypothetical protein [Salinibacterium sedimenticola]
MSTGQHPGSTQHQFRAAEARADLPPRIADLRDTTRCPACFTALRATTCHRCGLVLTHPDAAALAELSSRAAELFEQRVSLIAGMRAATAAAVASAPTDAVASVSPSSATPIERAAPPLPAPSAAPAAPPAPAATPPSTAPSARPAAAANASDTGRQRRSGVQVALLITGISLLSVFAVFFMVYAFINYGLMWRSLIIGVVTVAAFVGASLLRRRALVASSEATAVFALVLVYLDAFALRANGLLALDVVDGRGYWGTVLLVSGFGYIVWYRTARVRAAQLVGYAVIPVGVGLLVALATEELDAAASVYLIALTIALTTAVQHTAWLVPSTDAARRPAVAERILLTATGAPAILVAALVSIGLWPASPFGFTLGLLGCVAVAALHAFLHSAGTGGHDRSLAIAWSAGGGVFAAAAGGAYGLRSLADSELPLLIVVAPMLAVTLLVLLIAQQSGPRLRVPLRVASIGSALTAALALVPASILALGALAAHLVEAVYPPRVAALTLTEPWDVNRLDAWAALALAVLAGLGAAAMTRTLRRFGPLLAVLAVATALLAPPALPTPALAIALWSALGIAGLALRLARPALAPTATAIAALGGVTFAWTAGWAADDTWPFTSLLVVASALIGRRTLRSGGLRAVLAGTTTIVIILAAIAGTAQLLPTNGTSPPSALGAAAVLAAIAVVPRLPLGPGERRAVLWTAVTVAVLASFGILAQWSPSMPLPFVTIAAGIVLAGALAARASVADSAAERQASASLVAPAAALAVSTAAHVYLGEPAAALAPGLVAAIVAGVALLFSLRDEPAGHAATRWGFDVGAVVTLLPTLTAGATGTLDEGWIALALASITVALLATSSDGLTASQSRRRHLGWAALALATGALWWALADADITSPEPYVLPPALALVVIAILLRRRELDHAAAPARSSAWVLMLGLLLAIVPLTVATVGPNDEATIRAIATLAVSGALLVTASTVVARRSAIDRDGLVRLAAAASVPGLFGVLGVTALRSAQSIDSRTPAEVWLGPGALALVACAVVLCRIRPAATRTGGGQNAGVTATALATVRTAGAWIFRAALALIAVVEIGAALSDDDPAIRLGIVTGAFVCLHVASELWRTLPLGVLTGWMSFGFAAATAFVGAAHTQHLEQFSLPLALALLAAGSLALARDSAARSWPHLGPGIALLLMPSLLLTFIDPEVWRLVGLGVAAVITIVAGVMLRLQAPFVIGTIVVIAHALRTFAPQIRAVYELADWYIWAGIGGAIIMAIAIRYERRIRDLNRVVTSISGLR